MHLQLLLEGNQTVMERQEQSIAKHLELAGCYVITTDVAGAAMETRISELRFESKSAVL